MNDQINMAFVPTLEQKLQSSIAALRTFAPSDGSPYFGAFSGGKDSVVIKEVARLAGVLVDWHYHVTTIDPPELVRFIREHHADVAFDKPEHGFFTLMRKRGFPTRRARWCCEALKESKTPDGATLLVGVRAAESHRRAKTWQTLMMRNKSRTRTVAPILFWSDADVWEFIRQTGIKYCSLYDEGFTRLGCVGCPMARSVGRRAEFARWPKYEAAWKRGFESVWNRRTGSLQRDGRLWFGDAKFSNWQEMWEWWLSGEPLPNEECAGQLDLWVNA